jgi:hypothetical protein
MKNCPFCSEQIQDDAIKCKHCGEWLNKNNTDFIGKVGGIFKSGLSFIEEQKKKRDAKRVEHIYEPTLDTPFSFNGWHLYKSHLQYGYTRIEFEQIVGIIFHSSSNSTNGFSSNTSVIHKILYSTTDRISLSPDDVNEGTIHSGMIMTIGNRKEVEKAHFFHRLLQAYTLKYRVLRYINEIKKNGCFAYGGNSIIFNNGDLLYKDDTRVNIKVAYDNGLVSFGSKFKGLKTTTTDPFVFIIYPDTGIKVAIFGFNLSSRIELNTWYNMDCFEAIIEQIITKGKIVD